MEGAVWLPAVLVSGSGALPDSLNPGAAANGLGAGLDAVRGTPRERLRCELRLRQTAGRRPQGRRAPLWVRDLAVGDRARMAELTDVMRAVHGVVAGVDRSEATALAEAARVLRARRLRDNGVHGLLGSLGPFARWEPPVVYVGYPVDAVRRLAGRPRPPAGRGRGLRLVPPYFCWLTPRSPRLPAPPCLAWEGRR